MRISDWSSDVCASDLGEGRTARPSCDREPSCPPTRQRRLQVLKGQPHPRLTLRVSPYACPVLPHFLSEGTILTIYLAFPASFSTVESPRYCPDPGQGGRGIPETPFRFRSLRAIHFCDSLWGMDMNDLPRSEEHTSELQSLMRI